MPEEKQPIDPIDALRLEVERTRLALDKAQYQNDTTRLFLERWRVDVQPVHEHRLMSREHAHGFAKVAIQTTFLLNGGALIAFPAFAQLVGTGFRDHVGWALTSITGFVLGLVFIAVTALLAYLSMEADAEAVLQLEESVKARLNQSQVADEKKPKYDKLYEEAEAGREKRYAHAMRFRTWAVGLGIASMLAFTFGAFSAAFVLSAASPGA